jgi:rubrerythrin
MKSEQKNTIATTLHYYYFDTSKPDEEKLYEDLCNQLCDLGLARFNTMAMSNSSKYYEDTIAPLDGTSINLETDYLLNNQWNTAKTKTSDNGFRAFDWSEVIYPNKDIKEGMWLEQTDEMKELRKTKTKCHYCGKISDRTNDPKCPNCSSEGYLIKLDSKKSFDFIK